MNIEKKFIRDCKQIGEYLVSLKKDYKIVKIPPSQKEHLFRLRLAEIIEEDGGEGTIRNALIGYQKQLNEIEEMELIEKSSFNERFFNKFCAGAEKVFMNAFGEKYSRLNHPEINKFILWKSELKVKFEKLKVEKSTEQTGKRKKQKGNYIPPQQSTFENPLQDTSWYCFEIEENIVSLSVLSFLPSNNDAPINTKLSIPNFEEKIWEGEAKYIKDDNLLIATLFFQSKEYTHFTIQLGNQVEFVKLCSGQKTYTDLTKKGITTKKVILLKINPFTQQSLPRTYKGEEFDLLYPTIKDFLLNEKENHLFSLETPTVYNMQTFEKWHSDSALKGFGIQRYFGLLNSNIPTEEAIVEHLYLVFKEDWGGNLLAKLDFVRCPDDQMKFQGMVNENDNLFSIKFESINKDDNNVQPLHLYITRLPSKPSGSTMLSGIMIYKHEKKLYGCLFLAREHDGTKYPDDFYNVYTKFLLRSKNMLIEIPNLLGGSYADFKELVANMEKSKIESYKNIKKS